MYFDLIHPELLPTLPRSIQNLSTLSQVYVLFSKIAMTNCLRLKTKTLKNI